MSETPEVFRSEGFGRKVGPLPIWGWALILAGVAFVYVRFVHGSVTGGSSAGSPATPAYPNVQTTGGYLPMTQGSGSTGSGSAPLFTDNNSWENAAIQQASAYGSNPIELQAALDAYQKGGSATVTPSQESLINKVISAIGAPPISSGNGVPQVSDPNARKFTGFVQDPTSGTIAAAFSDNSISPYNNFNVFRQAQQALGNVPVQGVSHEQFAAYKPLPLNYQPGWSPANA